MSETKDWRKICADCKEGEPPKDCEYYGEPNGCNSPTYGKHPTSKDSLEVGNMAAMVNALKQIDRIVWDKRRHTMEEVEAHRLATEALTRPPRTCDVGTAEEQIKRWEKFCLEHHEYWKPSKSLTAIQRCNCPCHEGNGCNYFIWSQMPYEEEGAE